VAISILHELKCGTLCFTPRGQLAVLMRACISFQVATTALNASSLLMTSSSWMASWESPKLFKNFSARASIPLSGSVALARTVPTISAEVRLVAKNSRALNGFGSPPADCAGERDLPPGSRPVETGGGTVAAGAGLWDAKDKKLATTAPSTMPVPVDVMPLLDEAAPGWKTTPPTEPTALNMASVSRVFTFMRSCYVAEK
jgi:hypothetical protein